MPARYVPYYLWLFSSLSMIILGTAYDSVQCHVPWGQINGKWLGKVFSVPNQTGYFQVWMWPCNCWSQLALIKRKGMEEGKSIKNLRFWQLHSVVKLTIIKAILLLEFVFCDINLLNLKATLFFVLFCFYSLTLKAYDFFESYQEYLWKKKQ